MAAAALHAGIVHRGRLPDLSFGQKWDVGGEDADDGDAVAVETDCLADDARIGAEGAHPDAMAEDGGLRSFELFVGLGEVAADLWRDAERVEEICCDDALEDLLWAIAGEIRWAWVVVQGDEAVEGLIPGAIVEEVGWRDVGEIAEGEFAVEPDEAVGVFEGERAKDDRVDDAEDGGVGADAESEG